VVGFAKPQMTVSGGLRQAAGWRLVLGCGACPPSFCGPAGQRRIETGSSWLDPAPRHSSVAGWRFCGLEGRFL